MADRVDFYFQQLVSEADLDDAFDKVEQAVWNLPKDFGWYGIKTGMVISPTTPATWNVEASNPGIAYDEEGKRIYWGSKQTIDCSVDENGSSTLPSAGMKRYLTIIAEFDRNLQDLKVDGNGANVYYTRDEYFKIRVVMGSEHATTPPLPSNPSVGLILADILITDTHTSIEAGDLDTDRREIFQSAAASEIGVTASGWSVLATTHENLQQALDDIDANLLDLDGSGNVEQDILPDATATRDLGSASLRWLAYLSTLDVSANGTIGGTLGVTGLLTATAGILSGGDIDPDANGRDLGTATNRWDLFLQTCTVYGGSDLGGWLAFNAARSISKELDISNMVQDAWAADRWQYERGATWGGRTIYGWSHSSSSVRVGVIQLDLPHDVYLTDLQLTWWQESGTAALAAELFEVSNNGTASSKGSATISGTGTTAWKDKEAMGLTNFTTNRANKYILVVTGVANIDCAITGVVGLWDVTDIGNLLM